MKKYKSILSIFLLLCLLISGCSFDENIANSYVDSNSIGDLSENNSSLESIDESFAESAAQDTHVHTFIDATCTIPKTCSCGETDGSALGQNGMKQLVQHQKSAPYAVKQKKKH